MDNTEVVGIDLAKTVFHVFGMNKAGKETFRRKLSRCELLEFMVQCKTNRVVLEACSGSNYWAREFTKLGHKVSLIAAQYVKPYVKRNKNDMKDAEAICEAAQRPTMRYVSVRSAENQDVMNLHRVRQRLVRSRTALVNEIRGLLIEYGVVIPRGRKTFHGKFLEVFHTECSHLSELARETFQELWSEYLEVHMKVEQFDKKLERLTKENPVCQRLLTIPGVGVMTASAIVATVSDASVFKNGREFAAWTGLTPREYSTGGKQNLYGISKRGDVYLRTLLVHGARVRLQHVHKHLDRRSLWANDLKQRKGVNRSAVALANKNARTIWALMKNEDVYRELPLAA